MSTAQTDNGRGLHFNSFALDDDAIQGKNDGMGLPGINSCKALQDSPGYHIGS